MKPRRELDALVAEKVMRANKFEGMFVQKIDQETKTITVGTEWHYPPYSTDISAAWEVVEKMIKYNPFWEQENCIDFHLAATSPPGWTCNFGDDKTRVYASTAPHAICLAALKAVGIDAQETPQVHPA